MKNVFGRRDSETCSRTPFPLLSPGPQANSFRGVSLTSDTKFLLATVSSESIIRVWNVLEEESYLLSLSELDDSLMGDKATCIGKFGHL